MEVPVTQKEERQMNQSKDYRKYIGTRMSPADIRRARAREADERYGRIIEGVCPNCGKPIRKPKAGPTKRFCNDSCQNSYRQKRQHSRRLKAQKQSIDSALDFKRQSEDYLERAKRLNEQTRQLRGERRRIQEQVRLTLMTQLLFIQRGKPELIEQAPRDGYVAHLIRDIDAMGTAGDAERVLRHQGYTGAMSR